MNRYVFFRNDDIRSTLDSNLIKLTSIFIENKVPISLAVEPANISKEVVEWLLSIKEQYPEFIEIVQHGYSHKLNYKTVIGGKTKKGEFGGERSYKEQFDEIKKGKELMDKHFGDLWFPLFTFPYGARNNAALKVLNDLGFLVVNGSMGVSYKHKIAYLIGRLLKKEMIFGRKVSWHLRFKPDKNLFQIDTSISLIKKFYDEQTNCEFYSFKELKKDTLYFMQNTDVIGFVLHHRYDTKESLQMLDNFLKWLKDKENVIFLKQEDIYKKYAK